MEKESYDDIKGLLYNTMSQEAAGLYKQMIAICTAFLGGSIVFFEKLFVSAVEWSIYFLFAGWLALTYPLAVLMIIRWQNIESHRLMLEYLKSKDDTKRNQNRDEDRNEAKFRKVVNIAERGRKWTMSAILSMVIGLILIAIFTAINIGFLFNSEQKIKREVIMGDKQTKKIPVDSSNQKSLDPSCLVQEPKRQDQGRQDNNQTTQQSTRSNDKN